MHSHPSLQTVVGAFTVCEDDYYQLLCVRDRALTVTISSFKRNSVCARS